MGSNKKVTASSPVDALLCPLGWFAGWRLGRQAAADARLKVLPSKGSTPVLETIAALAKAAGAQLAEAARSDIATLHAEQAEVEASLKEAGNILAAAKQVLGSMPPRPDQDLPNAAPRALFIDGGQTNAQLTKTLTYAKESKELSAARERLERRIAQLEAQCAGLRTRLNLLPTLIDGVIEHARAEAGRSAAEANRRIARYRVTFVRRHRDPLALADLLPLKELHGDDLLTPFLDLAVDDEGDDLHAG